MSCENKEVNSGSTAFITLGWLDKDGVAITDNPTSGTYSIKDVLTGRMLRTDEPFPTLTQPIELTLTPADNVKLSSKYLSEQRQIISKAGFGAETLVGSMYYFVRSVA